jgi:hypothetical protein
MIARCRCGKRSDGGREAADGSNNFSSQGMLALRSARPGYLVFWGGVIADQKNRWSSSRI